MLKFIYFLSATVEHFDAGGARGNGTEIELSQYRQRFALVI